MAPATSAKPQKPSRQSIFSYVQQRLMISRIFVPVSDLDSYNKSFYSSRQYLGSTSWICLQKRFVQNVLQWTSTRTADQRRDFLPHCCASYASRGCILFYNVLLGFQKDWMKELSAISGAWKQVKPATGRSELESNGYVITQRSGLNIYTGLWVFSGCGLR